MNIKNAGQSDKSLAIESTNEQLNYVRWTPKVQDEMRNHLFFLKRELKLSYMSSILLSFLFPPFLSSVTEDEQGTWPPSSWQGNNENCSHISRSVSRENQCPYFRRLMSKTANWKTEIFKNRKFSLLKPPRRYLPYDCS